MKCHLIVLMISLGLTGCVSVRPPARFMGGTHQSFTARSKHLRKLTHWIISGAAGIVQPKGSESANYTWQQIGKSYAIQLAGALNVGSTRITGGVGWVNVSRANGKHWQGNSPNELIAKSLGWRLPVAQLFYWVRGIPAPLKYAHLKTDSLGHLQSLSQLGWTISWSRYAPVGNVDLPRWIVLQRPGWKIKLLIRQWVLQ